MPNQPSPTLTPAEIDSLFQQTLQGDYEDEDEEHGPWEAIGKLQAVGSREVFDKAAQWARNNKPAKRRRGIDILAQLGIADHDPSQREPGAQDESHDQDAQSRDGSLSAAPRQPAFANETYTIVAEVLEDELDLKVIESCLVAFGHIGNPAAVPLILDHRANTDPDIRFAVAFSLGSFADEPEAIPALLQLMEDEDSDIRDWATFALGVQGSADSPEIRAALLERLDDEDPDTREEAVAGLAKRRELRVLPDLLDLLQQEEVSYGVVEAAASLLDLPGIDEAWDADAYIDALTTRYKAELERYD